MWFSARCFETFHYSAVLAKNGSFIALQNEHFWAFIETEGLAIVISPLDLQIMVLFVMKKLTIVRIVSPSSLWIHVNSTCK